MKTHLLRLTTLLAFTACGATPEVAPPAPAAPAPPVPMSVAPASTPASAPATVETRTQAEDGPLETASGATWPVAAGWSITRTTSADAASPLYVLRDPE